MKRQLRVIVVGGGFFGTKRLTACLSLPKLFTVIGVVDASEKIRAHIEQAFHVPTFPSLSSVSSRADLAIIAVPNAFHAKLAVMAIKMNMHVLCEKPLAVTFTQAKKIASAAKTHNKIVKTGSNHRFFRPIQKAKELIDKGAIGNILLFRGSIGTNGGRISNQWFWDKKTAGGGTLIDNGCHVLDIARMFMGDFQSCTAHTTNTFWKDTQVEDIGSAIFVTKDGRQAIISSSWIQWAGYLHIEVWGTKGYAIIDSTTTDTLTIGKRGGECVIYDYSHEPKDSYQRELVYLASCIKNNKQPNPNANDGASVIAMIEAAYLSSHKKSWSKIKV